MPYQRYPVPRKLALLMGFAQLSMLKRAHARHYQQSVYSSSIPVLMTEVANARKYHRHIMLVGCLNDFIIADRATRLNHTANAIFRGVINAITEREKRIGCHYRALGNKTCLLGFYRSDTCRIYTAHLACANTH